MLLYFTFRLRYKILLAHQSRMEQAIESSTYELRIAHETIRDNFRKQSLELEKFKNDFYKNYTFLSVEEQYKSIVVDVLNGFKDYAQLKGYQVKFIIDTNVEGKVGFRFEHLGPASDIKVNVMGRDLEEYIDSLGSGIMPPRMPVILDIITHNRLEAVLHQRFTSLQSQLRMLSTEIDFYRNFVEGIKASILGKITEQHHINLVINNQGIKKMRDSYSVSSSQNVAQGKGASASTDGSHVLVESSCNDYRQKALSLKQLEDELEEGVPDGNHKDLALRYTRSARKEFEEKAQPDTGLVVTWLQRVGESIRLAGAASDVVAGLDRVLHEFNIL